MKFKWQGLLLRSIPRDGTEPAGGSPTPSPTPSPSSSTPSATPSPSPSPSPSSSPSPSPSPASSSSPGSAPTAVPSGEGDTFNYDQIFGGIDEVEPSGLAPPALAEPKPPVVPVAPAPAPVAAPAAPVAPTAPTPPAPAVAASPPGAGAAPVSPPLDPADPFSLARMLVENEPAAIDHIAKNVFALTNEELEALESNVAETVPKLFAKAYVKQQQNMLNQMGRLIPQMIGRHAELTKKNSENEAKFFDRWKGMGLDSKEHTKTLQQYAVTYRQMHPEATLEQMIEDLGPLVAMAVQAKPQAAAPPGVPGSTPLPKAVPFVPAVPGATPVSSTQVEGSEWDILGQSPEG